MTPAELSDATKLAIQRQKDGPWCDACGNSMPQKSRDRGELTHPKCAPHDQPEPKVSAN